MVEIAILSAAAMYIAYLHYTGGVESEEERKKINKDGSSEVEKKRKFYSSTDALAANSAHAYWGWERREKKG